MIPRLIHRIWLDDPMPDPFAGFGQAWQDLHPGWEVIDWRCAAVLPVLRNRDLFDRAAELYPHDWKRFQADLLRLELLWRYGGLYVDTDTAPHRNLEPLLADALCLAGRSPQTWRGKHPITNAVMAAIPAHPFVGACIEAIPEAVANYRGKPLARSVGPWLLTRTYESAEWPSVTVLSHREMYGGRWLTHSWNSAARRRGEGVA